MVDQMVNNSTIMNGKQTKKVKRVVRDFGFSCPVPTEWNVYLSERFPFIYFFRFERGIWQSIEFLRKPVDLGAGHHGSKLGS